MMTVKGNIWQLVRTHLDYLVVPTNIGYNKQGLAVMGRGIAAQAARRYPDLEMVYGEICRRGGPETAVTVLRPRPALHPLPSPHLVLFPTKPMNKNFPFLSWRNDSELSLISRSLQELAALIPTFITAGMVLIPDVGCGFGRLKTSEVRPLIESYLSAFDRVIHVVYKRETR